MAHVYWSLIPGLWILWAAYWWAASRNVKTVARAESLASRAQHVAPLALAMVLLALPRFPVPVLGERFLPWPEACYWSGAALTLLGLLFTVWARVHLGGNWSGIITVKESHELVTSGPYGIVRHPIYTGLLLAFLGSGLARPEWRSVAAVLIACGALWRKLRIEERFMREQFGPAYEAYSARVRALVPYLL